jgi:hypothetical protein
VDADGLEGKAKDLLSEMHILLVVMEVTGRMQDAGLSKAEALIAARTLTFLLEELPPTLEQSREKGEVLGPALHKFIGAELAELHDRE